MAKYNIYKIKKDKESSLLEKLQTVGLSLAGQKSVNGFNLSFYFCNNTPNPFLPLEKDLHIVRITLSGFETLTEYRLFEIAGELLQNWWIGMFGQVGWVKLRIEPINVFFLLGVLRPSITSVQASPNLLL